MRPRAAYRAQAFTSHYGIAALFVNGIRNDEPILYDKSYKNSTS